MEIKPAKSHVEKDELDQLLWDVLWKPLNFQRNIRNSFKLDKPQIDLIAIDQNKVVGGLVASQLSKNEIEIRHIAVRPEYQRRSVGRLLIQELIGRIQKNTVIRVRTYTRNTSVGFFSKLGFTPRGDFIKHEDFARHGIRLQQMCFEVSPINSQQE